MAAITKSETSPGVLLSSGLIAGGSLGGVLIAFFELPMFSTVKKAINFGLPAATPGGDPEPRFSFMLKGKDMAVDVAPLVPFLLLIGFLVLVGMGKLFKAKEEPAA